MTDGITAPGRTKTLLKRLNSSGAIGSMISSAGVLVSRLGGVALTLAYTLLIARLMSPAEVGISSTLTSTMTFAAFLATLNFESGALRYLVHALAAKDDRTAKGFLVVGQWLLWVGGPLAAVAHFFIVHALKPSFPVQAVFLASLGVPVLASLIYFARAVSQLGYPTRSQLANLFVRPLVLLIIVGCASLLIKLSVVLLTAALLGSCVIGWFAQRILLANGRGLPRIEGPGDISRAPTWLASGVMLAPRLIIEQYLPDFVIMAASAALSHAEIGVLMVVMRCSNMIRFAAVSVEMAITPRLARADAQNNHAERDRILAMASHMRFWPVFAVSVITFVLAPWILQIFGPAYVAGAWALRISLITPVALALFGPSHVLLVVRGHIKVVGALATVAL
ncbi:MAG: hypothetical protein JWM33_1344, partial [Caulobacteraceae bacterium]|nr:hypothetical protein [Caulobacteraceae bacterium]